VIRFGKIFEEVKACASLPFLQIDLLSAADHNFLHSPILNRALCYCIAGEASSGLAIYGRRDHKRENEDDQEEKNLWDFVSAEASTDPGHCALSILRVIVKPFRQPAREAQASIALRGIS
jgi:hypothetical protein